MARTTDQRQRLAELTLALCGIPSVTGNEKAICDFLAPWCERHFPGAVRRVSNSLVAGRLDDPRPTVALVGHLDTVPGSAGDGPARLADDRVIGLGSSDMKSGVAVMMALAEDLPRAALPYNLVLVFYEREEGPFEENGLGPLLAATPELRKTALAFCLESTDNEVQVGCAGSMHARVEFRGRRAHSARPWQGENAIHKAGALLAKLASREPRRVEIDGFEFFEVLSATLARGGIARNVVPDGFELNLNFRFAPGRSLDDAEHELRAFIGDGAEITIVDRAPSGRVCADNPLFQRFRAATGVRAASKQAWTDVARLTANGIDAVNFGPGLTSQAHQAGEYVLVDDLIASYGHLRAFLESRADSPR